MVGSGSSIVPVRIISHGNVNVYGTPFNPCVADLLSILVSIYEHEIAGVY